MKHAAIVCNILLMAVFAIGCTDQKTPTALSDDTPVVLFKISNAPANSGPIVTRDQRNFAVFYVDTKTGISAVHGADIVDFCKPPIGTTADLLDRQRVFLPNEAAAVNDLLQGSDMTTSVWPFTVFDCNAFLTTTPLATGTVDIVNTDNDFFAFLRSSPARANAFGFNANGRLNLSGGGTAQFSGHSRAVFKPGESLLQSGSDNHPDTIVWNPESHRVLGSVA